MGIEIRTTFDASALGEEIIKRKELAFARAIEQAKEEIVSRSNAQIGYDGARFVGLSEGYRKWKQKKTGRGYPDLLLNGKMLAAINTAVERLGKGFVGRIFFNSVKEAEKARGNMKIRKFFGLSKEQISKLVDLMRNA